MSQHYSSFYSHGGMLLDEVRNSAYARAIDSFIGPGTTVLDLGAGLGLLGLLAAKAGARRVYLVDPSTVLEDVPSILEANGLEDRVTLVNRPIQETELPEKVDVLISVMTGNFLLQEDLLPTLFLARDRFLKASGVLLPGRATMVATPVALNRPERYPAFRLKHDLQGLDFSPVRSRFVNRVQFHRYFEDDVRILSAPQSLAEFDFLEAKKAEVDATLHFRADSDGQVDGILGWFDMELGDERLSTGPLADPVHWKQAFLPLDSPVKLHKGESLMFSLKRPERGEWTWSVNGAGEEQKMSTFYGRRPDLESLKRLSPVQELQITPECGSASFVLERISAGVTRGGLEEQFLQWEGRHVKDRQLAREWLLRFLRQVFP